jgi:cytochrome P450
LQTPVSLTQKFIHENPEIFPNPHNFSPERWVDPADRKHLEKYLTPFGRGSRVCVGMK